ncbi:hypothetical protein [Saccharopolyspora sp. SCSIO 74807]|uniref:hypothetical protein n=1 Tax=Saccharopolyspora sp. SCSIO 74807 TaxID=3118084 RepID=UPI0030CD6D70
MRFANPITVTVRRFAVDGFGDETVTAEFTLTGCALAQQSSEGTPGDFRQETTTRLRLLAPAGAALHAGDEVTLPGGARFRVSGTPSTPRSPFTGWRPGLVADIEDMRG